MSVRLKSVKNIEKITKSMKMVSAAKFQLAERELKPARTYGEGAQGTHAHSHTLPPKLVIYLNLALFEKAEILEEERKPKHLVVAISSDRGLCGSVHSNVARYIRSMMAERGQDASTTMFVCVGDKVRTILQRQFKSNILMHFTEIGRKPPLFMEANFVAEQILNSGIEYDSAEIVFNRFRYVCILLYNYSVHVFHLFLDRNVVSYRTSSQYFLPFDILSQSGKNTAQLLKNILFSDIVLQRRCFCMMMLILR